LGIIDFERKMGFFRILQIRARNVLKLLQWQKLIAARFFFAGNDLVQSGIQTCAGV
jgi:hypothetical protein